MSQRHAISERRLMRVKRDRKFDKHKLRETRLLTLRKRGLLK